MGTSLQFSWPGCGFDVSPYSDTSGRIRRMGAAVIGHAAAGAAAPAFDRLRAVAVIADTCSMVRQQKVAGAAFGDSCRQPSAAVQPTPCPQRIRLAQPWESYNKSDARTFAALASLIIKPLEILPIHPDRTSAPWRCTAVYLKLAVGNILV